ARAVRAQDLNAVPLVALHRRSARANWRGAAGSRVQRLSGDHGHATPVARDQIFGELRQELTGRRLVRPVGTVEETDVHVVRYHSMVRRSPSSNFVVASKPNAWRARVTSSERRGWPSGLVRSNTRRPVNPVSLATSSARSRMLISKPAPMLTGSAPS